MVVSKEDAILKLTFMVDIHRSIMIMNHIRNYKIRLNKTDFFTD